MDTKTLLEKVKRIEIKTRRLSQELFSGEYHSAFKGQGILFDRVREYNEGDDVRFMDWKVTAKLNHPYIKVFQEERELSLVVMVDISASSDFGTHFQLKRDLITEISALLAFSASSNQDKTGLLLFSDQVEKFIPPKKGRTHTLKLIREIVDIKPKSQGTDISKALKYLHNIVKKRCVVFLISDFIDQNLEQELKIYSKQFDLIGIQIFDIREREMPDLGLIHFKDTETGKMVLIDTSQKKVREDYFRQGIENDKKIQQDFMNAGSDFIRLRTDQSYIGPLLNLMKKRHNGIKRS